MPTATFIIIAIGMVFAALALVVVPLTRRGDTSPIAAGVMVGLVPLTVSLLYFTWSNWPWQMPVASAVESADESIPSIDQMVSQLEARLRESPDDAEGWQMLGRSYVVLNRYPDAVEAYSRARDLTNDSDVHSITGYAEALALVRGGVLDPETGALFERALAMDPGDRKALWYGGLAAFENGRPGIARSRWQRLLEQGPTAEVAAVLREQIAAAEAMLGEAGESAGAPSGQVIPARDGISVTVSLSPELAGSAPADAPVFVLARPLGGQGPPLAVVRRTVAELPLAIVLTDEHAMVPGRVLSAHDTVEVVARVSLGGTPTAQVGDLSGTQRVSTGGNIQIVIDEVVRP